ncbi:hypothetical protein [Pseudalkalibacillus hwajinpoensis]|nr:hypothetical protein [Pseudalkalibacillus hwajinpoensis]
MNTVFVFGLKGEAIEDLATAAGSNKSGDECLETKILELFI